MRIAQVAPLIESVPPKKYESSERIVSYLTDALVDLGHEVTLFASGNSRTKAKLVAQTQEPLSDSMPGADPVTFHMLMMERVCDAASEFDVIHSHVGYFPFPVFRRCRIPIIHTLHGRLDAPETDAVTEGDEIPLMSLSYAQKDSDANQHTVETIYHGLPENLFSFYPESKGYLAFFGRIAPEKRLDVAIEIAEASRIPLKIGVHHEGIDPEYFQRMIEPALRSPWVDFAGELPGEEERNEFLGNALALISTMDWPEPLGLSIVEALASGTPVIAKSERPMPEVLQTGKNGFLIQNVPEAVDAVRHCRSLSRKVCRKSFEDRFTSRRMAQDFELLYTSTLKTSLSV